MRKTFLGSSFVSLALLVGSACGGKVVVDLPGGNGGAGGVGGFLSSSSGTFTTGTSVSSSSGTGACGCDQFCSALAVCGATTGNCLDFCNQTPPSVRDCVCSINSCNLQACFGGTGGTGGTGEIPPECADCANKSAESDCVVPVNDCMNNPECVAILECHQNCGWTFDCAQQCEGSNPAGANDFSGLMGCAICKSCFTACAGTSIEAIYCEGPP